MRFFARLICMIAFILPATIAAAEEQVEVYNLRGAGPLELRAVPRPNGDVTARVVEGTILNQITCNQDDRVTWCRVVALDGRYQGWATTDNLRPIGAPKPPRPQPPAPDPGIPGNELVEVFGLNFGNTLSVREAPSTNANRVARLNNGDRVLRGGCKFAGGDEWCRVDDQRGRFAGWSPNRNMRRVPNRPDPNPSPGPGTPGDTLVEVRGLAAGDRLNVRTEPSTRAPIVMSLKEGARVLRGTCRRVSGTDWCRVDDQRNRFSGWAAARYLSEVGRPPPGGGGGGGGDIVTVGGLGSFDRLNIRSGPSTGSRIIASVPNGTRLRSLGCQTVGSTRWCSVADLRGAFSGWAAARYLTGGGTQVPEPPRGDPRIERGRFGTLDAIWRDGCVVTFDARGRLIEADRTCTASQISRSTEAVLREL